MRKVVREAIAALGRAVEALKNSAKILWTEVKALWPNQTRSPLAITVTVSVAAFTLIAAAALPRLFTPGGTSPTEQPSGPRDDEKVLAPEWRAGSISTFRLSPTTLLFSPPSSGFGDRRLLEFAGVFETEVLREALTPENCILPNSTYDSWWLAREVVRHRANTRDEVLRDLATAVRESRIPEGTRGRSIRSLLSWLEEHHWLTNARVVVVRPPAEEIANVSQLIQTARALLNERPDGYFLTPPEQVELDPTDPRAVSPFNVVFDVVLANDNTENLIIDRVRFFTDAVGSMTGGAGDAEHQPAYPLYEVADVSFVVGENETRELENPIVIPPGSVARFSVEAIPGGSFQHIENEIVTHWIGRFSFISAQGLAATTPRTCVFYPFDIGVTL